MMARKQRAWERKLPAGGDVTLDGRLLESGGFGLRTSNLESRRALIYARRQSLQMKGFRDLESPVVLAFHLRESAEVAGE
jgi:hypothetical protein